MARKTILFQNTGKKSNSGLVYWQKKQFWFSILARKTILVQNTDRKSNSVQYTGKKNNSGLEYWQENNYGQVQWQKQFWFRILAKNNSGSENWQKTILVQHIGKKQL